MNGSVVFLFGTLLLWAGWVLALVAVHRWVSSWVAPAALKSPLRRSAVLTALLAGAGHLAGGGLLPPVEFGYRFPLVWPIAPFAAWATAVAALVGVGWLARAPLGLPQERRSNALTGVMWLAAAVVFFLVFRASGDTVTLVTGGVSLRPGQVLALTVVTFGAVFAFAGTSRALRARAIAKGVATHLALLAGSVVFGLPFAWLLITSFKEDVDMASADGLVWVPKVQVTVPYRNPNEPMVTARFEGQTVTGRVMQVDAQGLATVEVRRPLALSSKTFLAPMASLTEIDQEIPVVTFVEAGQTLTGKVVQEDAVGHKVVEVTSPAARAGERFTKEPSEIIPVRTPGLRWQNYSDALDYLPPETAKGLVYLRNTLLLVVLNILGTVLSSSLVAYAFARLRFPGRNTLFLLLISTMMLPAAVTLLPTFLIFRSLGWIDTLKPLWVTSFFAGAFNVFLLRQFFLTLPAELEDASKIDGCSYVRTYWSVMMPQIKPALAVISVWTFIGTWNNFMGPLIYINSPENMPIAYAVQLFQSDRGSEPGLMMALATVSMLPVLLLFAFAQRYFIEGVTLSGLGGR